MSDSQQPQRHRPDARLATGALIIAPIGTALVVDDQCPPIRHAGIQTTYQWPGDRAACIRSERSSAPNDGLLRRSGDADTSYEAGASVNSGPMGTATRLGPFQLETPCLLGLPSLSCARFRSSRVALARVASSWVATV